MSFTRMEKVNDHTYTEFRYSESQVEIWDTIYAKKYRFKRKLYSNPCKSNNWMMKVNNVPEGKSLQKKKKKKVTT